MVLFVLSKGGEAAQDDEAKRNASVSQERQRTLDRLRSLKQVTLQSQRCAFRMNSPVSLLMVGFVFSARSVTRVRL